jgi:hypothetical protein
MLTSRRVHHGRVSNWRSTDERSWRDKKKQESLLFRGCGRLGNCEAIVCVFRRFHYLFLISVVGLLRTASTLPYAMALCMHIQTDIKRGSFRSLPCFHVSHEGHDKKLPVTATPTAGSDKFGLERRTGFAMLRIEDCLLPPISLESSRTVL